MYFSYPINVSLSSPLRPPTAHHTPNTPTEPHPTPNRMVFPGLVIMQNDHAVNQMHGARPRLWCWERGVPGGWGMLGGGGFNTLTSRQAAWGQGGGGEMAIGLQ